MKGKLHVKGFMRPKEHMVCITDKGILMRKTAIGMQLLS